MLDEFEASDQIAEWLVAKSKKDPRIASIIHSVQIFEDLKGHPAWRKLMELAEKEKGRFFDRISKRMWAYPDDPLPTTEEIVYHKGFYQGCIWVLKHPEMAEASLESAARAAWLMSQGEMQEAEESIE